MRLTTVSGLVVSSCALVLVLTGTAFGADPTVAIPNGPLHESQVITVTGTGFPIRAQDPTGLQILECSDPNGSSANLPTDATYSCDGTTTSPGQINTDAKGDFSAAYTIFALNSVTGGSDIDCDASHFCVLWVGTDYNNAFTFGPHAFSKPFEVTGTAASSSSSPPDITSPPPTSGNESPAGSSAVASGGTPTSGASAGAGTLASTGVSGLLWWLVILGLLMAVGGTVGRTLMPAGALPAHRGAASAVTGNVGGSRPPL